MRIMKFGGAALRDGAAIAHVAGIVRQAPYPRVVVASAMQGVTDALTRAVDEVARDESQVVVLLDGMRTKHEEALQHVAPQGDDAAQYGLHATLERLERLLYGIAYTGEATPRLRDLVATFGERLSIIVLAAAIRRAGSHAVHMDAEHAGVRSAGPFGNARPDIPAMTKAVPEQLGRMIDAGDVPVITGFYGVDPDGHATLFGRGGSDYVASLLGVALQAESVELWKDVPGFLTADPEAVADAMLVDELGYDEAAELAQFGAKVLHPRAVEPVADADIPILIRSVRDPAAPHSVVRKEVGPAPALVRATASRDGLAIVRLNGAGMAATPGVAKRVFDAIPHINVLNLSTSQATFALLMTEGDAEPARDALAPLVGGVIQSIEVLPQRSLVCVVGKGLGDTPGAAADILQAVADAGVNIEMISLGASDIAIDFIVKSSDRAAALRGVHDHFMQRVTA